MVMIRKQIYLSPEDDRRLKAEAKRRQISEAAVIRGKLGSSGGSSTPSRYVPNEKARKEAITALRRLRIATPEDPGAGRIFNREDAYAERLDRIGSHRHKRPRLRG